MPEIQKKAEKPVLCILFMHHFYFKSPLNYKSLKEEGIISSAPQSIVEISQEQYSKIKKLGGLDERFIVN